MRRSSKIRSGSTDFAERAHRAANRPHLPMGVIVKQYRETSDSVGTRIKRMK
jgi:hypothetical protein